MGRGGGASKAKSGGGGGTATKPDDDGIVWTKFGGKPEHASDTGLTTNGVMLGSALTRAERNAAYDYSGVAYTDINAAARFGFHKAISAADRAVIRQQTKALDSAIRKGSLAADTVVYRGISLHALGGKIPKRGSVMSDKGFLSASVSKNVASQFSNGVMLRITAKKGTRALDVSHHSGGAEREVLFRRGAKLKVKSTSHDEAGRLTINVEMR